MKRYNYYVMLAAAMLPALWGCGRVSEQSEVTSAVESTVGSENDSGSWKEQFGILQSDEVEESERLVYKASMELQYAQEFQVDYYEGDYTLMSTSDGVRFFIVPQGAKIPKGLAEDVVVVKQPVENIYLAATAAMGLFDALDSLDVIALSSLKAESWYVAGARQAMEEGRILYGGKYNEPDYESILNKGCKLAVESTMIYHVPEVKEKLEELGISVMVDKSSYETHPLGRTEWIKFYAVLVDKEEEAAALFQNQVDMMNEAASGEDTGKTVAFFSISEGGYAIARRSGDYVTKMIELAGGSYIFKDLGEDNQATGTVFLEMEQFYATAKDADIIIYNGSLDGGLTSVEELIAQNPLLAEFKAVKEGNVWSTGKNLFQENTDLGQAVLELHQIFDGQAEKLEFFTKLE
ncbi:MAG: ABC transporter substrate-binding protein [Lachnospiraceae bacterium]